MAVKFDKKKATIRLNACIDELTTCKDKERHEQLVKEIETLDNALSSHNEGKSKTKEAILKTGLIITMAYAMSQFDKIGIFNKNCLGFLPKHI